MTYLVDSDWVADYLKGRQHAVQVLDSLFRDGLAISIVTCAEIYEGIYYGSDPKRNEEIFARFLQGVDVLGINRPVARRFAMIRGALREAGQLIPQPDSSLPLPRSIMTFPLSPATSPTFKGSLG